MGGVAAEVKAALAANPGLVAGSPADPRAAIPRVAAPGHPERGRLTLETTATRSKGDPAFRQRVLKAYEYRCAVCGFDVRLGTVSIALDAAHIRWHQAGGPETEGNGLAPAYCTTRRSTWAPSPSSEGVLLVSDQANGTTGYRKLLAYHGKPIRTRSGPIGGRSPPISSGTGGRC